MGIDLGTTFSVVGINYGNGKVVIVEDKKSKQRIFPSIVSYHENGDIFVGYDAMPYLTTHPKNTIYNAKRFIGRNLEEAEVKQYAADHSYDVVPHKSNFSQVGFALPFVDKQTGQNKIVIPEEVGAQVLKFLLKITAEFLGYNNVNKAVIAVPAKFSPEQRQVSAFPPSLPPSLLPSALSCVYAEEWRFKIPCFSVFFPPLFSLSHSVCLFKILPSILDFLQFSVC